MTISKSASSRPRTLSAAVIAGLTFLVGASGASAQATSQEQVDAAIVEQALHGGFQAVWANHQALLEILDRAPARYPKIEQDGDQWIIRPDSDEEGAVLTARALPLAIRGIALATSGKNITIDRRPNIYPMASFLLGSLANETRKPEEALKFLDRGLTIQSDDPMLIAEKAASLELLRRPADALALVESSLGNETQFDDLSTARMLRAKGYALVELGRLDEAEAAYNASLKAEPGHCVALSELVYIRGLKGGRGSSAGAMISGDLAKTCGNKPS